MNISEFLMIFGTMDTVCLSLGLFSCVYDSVYFS